MSRTTSTALLKIIAYGTIYSICALKKSGFYPRTILDIGAQVGDFGVPVHEIWPEAKIFMIEANKDHEIHLKGFLWISGYEIALLGDKNKRKLLVRRVL